MIQSDANGSHPMRTIYRTTFSVFALFFAAVAQQTTAPAVPEPDTLNLFYRLDNGKLVSLEPQTTSGVQLQHGFMSSKAAGVTELSGGQSPVRFKAGPLEFVVATGGDPAVFSLRKLEIKKGKRGDSRELLIVTSQASVFHAGKMNMSQRTIPLDFTRYGSSSYRAVPKEPLTPGEYAFWRPDGQVAFCFGVD